MVTKKKIGVKIDLEINMFSYSLFFSYEICFPLYITLQSDETLKGFIEKSNDIFHLSLLKVLKRYCSHRRRKYLQSKNMINV